MTQADASATPDPRVPSLLPATGPDDIATARALFLEYMQSLKIDLSFQDVDTELAGLPGKYAPPGGVILVARDCDGGALGYVAVRPLELGLPALGPPGLAGGCEMKRLYVRPAARGQDLGRRLAEAAIGFARIAGYAAIHLDTLPLMQAAQGLYARLGFKETPPYYNSPIAGTRFLRRNL